VFGAAGVILSLDRPVGSGHSVARPPRATGKKWAVSSSEEPGVRSQKFATPDPGLRAPDSSLVPDFWGPMDPIGVRKSDTCHLSLPLGLRTPD
jgi:hypothetical protein